MPTSLKTRTTDGGYVEIVNNAPLSNTEIDNNFITLAENKLEVSNNLSDIPDLVTCRQNINVPSVDGEDAFGTWPISISGSAQTASFLTNTVKINNVEFDANSDITIKAESPYPLLLGDGLQSNPNSYDGSQGMRVDVNLNGFDAGSFNAEQIRVSSEVVDYIASDAINIENVANIPDALDKVIAIGGKLFDWTDEHLKEGRAKVETSTDSDGNPVETVIPDGYYYQKSDFGVVAQDVQDVFPQAVRRRPNGDLAVDYRKLFALSFAAIKELNDKI